MRGITGLSPRTLDWMIVGIGFINVVGGSFLIRTGRYDNLASAVGGTALSLVIMILGGISIVRGSKPWR